MKRISFPGPDASRFTVRPFDKLKALSNINGQAYGPEFHRRANDAQRKPAPHFMFHRCAEVTNLKQETQNLKPSQ